MSARTLTQGTAIAGRGVSLRPETDLAGLVGTCESYPFARPMTWSTKQHNHITGAPAGTTESPPTG